MVLQQSLNMNKERSEYGDWQTPYQLAMRVCLMLKEKGITPTTIFEPTCGEGTFIRAALEVFRSIKRVYAVEIYKPYINKVQELKEIYPNVDFCIYHQSIFDFDFNIIKDKNILILGNPPWVTNSQLGSIGSENLPQKSNFKNHKGLEAITGKGNFDIAEYILISIFQRLHYNKGHFALLVKNSVIKNIVLDNETTFNIGNLYQYEIDTLKEFGASTSASLFLGELGTKEKETICKAYNIYNTKYIKTFGLINGNQISDIDSYKRNGSIDGSCQFEWRSGIKHDCSKVMEITIIEDDKYSNGLKETFKIEEDCVYPLIKSSDIAKFKGEVRKYLIVTQKNTSDSTKTIAIKCPLTYEYLLNHAEFLDNRKSSIYSKRPRFCIFGIGDYSFMPYKIVISALYKTTFFSLLYPLGNKPIMVDDTCYSIGFMEKRNADITLKLLNGTYVQDFIKSISYSDAKRVITKDILMRIDLEKALEKYTYKELSISEEEYSNYQAFLTTINYKSNNSKNIQYNIWS